MTVRHTSHARYDFWYHFAWSTKYRKKVWLDDAEREAVKRLFREVAGNYDLAIGEIELLSDHIHFTLTAPPWIAPPARAAQMIKSVTTRLLFRQYPRLKRIYWGDELWGGPATSSVRSAPASGRNRSTSISKEQSEEM